MTTDDDAVQWLENAAPKSRLPQLRISDVWRHWELIFFFAQRDVKVRYKQAFLGAAWALLQPLIGALTFTIVFSGLADIEVDDGSYFTFALSGFVVWTYFSTAVSAGASSLLVNANLLTKVSFPRIVAPIAAMLPPLADLAVGTALTIVVAAASGVGLSPVRLLVSLPLGLGLLLAAVAGPILFFSASIVRYRDASALVSLGLQFVLFVSPVAYPPELVPERWQGWYFANPVAGALGLFRAALLSEPVPSIRHLMLSVAVAAALLVLGLFHFRANERGFADII